MLPALGPGATECFTEGRTRALRLSACKESALGPELGVFTETVVKERSTGARRVARS